jgi:hypothetical protein
VLAFCHSQTINNVTIRDIDIEFIQIVESKNLTTGDTFVDIDLGKQNRLFSTVIVKDANGKRINFESPIDALNFMTKNGYEFVQAYTNAYRGELLFSYYLLRKKKTT